MHLLLHDIAALVINCTVITIQHVCWEVNSADDWIITYIAEHLEIFCRLTMVRP